MHHNSCTKVQAIILPVHHPETKEITDKKSEKEILEYK